MLSLLRRAKRKFFPKPYIWEREIPPPSINYNQPKRLHIKDYVREFKEGACLREIPFFIQKGLRPDGAFLDYGCGLGRIAYPASKYLTDEGAYFGYEPQEGARKFLIGAYGHKPNFHFAGQPLRLSDDYVAREQNQKRAGGAAAAVIDLSFVTRPIDIQYSHSVFTHMYEDAIIETLRAISKVMAPTGIFINTWLCVDDFAAYATRCGVADRTFPYRFGNMLAVSQKSPLQAVGYPLEIVRNIYDASGHEIIKILYGSWSGRENGVTFQDVVLSRVKG
jgi:SAM-dependent methyltransferase